MVTEVSSQAHCIGYNYIIIYDQISSEAGSEIAVKAHIKMTMADATNNTQVIKRLKNHILHISVTQPIVNFQIMTSMTCIVTHLKQIKAIT